MKLKITISGGGSAWVGADHRPSTMVGTGENTVVDAEEYIVVAGNPLDPWRIVVTIEEVKDK